MKKIMLLGLLCSLFMLTACDNDGPCSGIYDPDDRADCIENYSMP